MTNGSRWLFFNNEVTIACLRTVGKSREVLTISSTLSTRQLKTPLNNLVCISLRAQVAELNFLCHFLQTETMYKVEVGDSVGTMALWGRIGVTCISTRNHNIVSAIGHLKFKDRGKLIKTHSLR